MQLTSACLLAVLSEQELASADLICRPRPKRRRAAHAKGLAKACKGGFSEPLCCRLPTGLISLPFKDE